MKKILLVVLAFFSLTAFDIKKVEAPEVKNITEGRSFHIKPIPQVLTPAEGKITVKKGQTIQIITSAAGEPTPTSSVWIHNGGKVYELKVTDRIRIEKLGANVTITIKDAKREDSGIYEVLYENIAGFASAYATVVVKEKPTQL